VFQSYALWPHLTVMDNIAMGLKVRERSKEEIRWRVERTMKSLEIAGLENRYPSQLSGGQQQRVAVARAVVVEPEILLFDEPLSNLDARIRERVRGELHDLLREFGITTLYVTHDKAEAMALSDRIVVMRSGVIEQVGSAREIYERPATSFVADFIGRYNFLPGALAGSPGAVHSINVRGQRVALMGPDAAPAGTIGFKPEDVVLATTPGENVFEVPVVRQTYFGGFVEVVSELVGVPIVFALPDEVSGPTVRIRLPADKLSYFDRNGRAQARDASDQPLPMVAE
jgi:iron(III) transport system ATP-binding protein